MISVILTGNTAAINPSRNIIIYRMRKNTHTMITHNNKESSPKHPLPTSSM